MSNHRGMKNRIILPTKLLLDPSMPVSAVRLYAVVLAMAPDGKTLVCPQTRLQELLGLKSASSLRHCAKILAVSGWMTVDSHRGSQATAYTVQDPYEIRAIEEREAAKQRLANVPHFGEALSKEWLNRMVDSKDYIDNARMEFLTNPLTNSPMEYDRFYIKHRVAFEFNGPQHDGPTERYPDRFQAAKRRSYDAMKAGFSAEHGVTLIIIRPEDLTFSRMRQKIGNLLPLTDVDEEDPVIKYLTQVSQDYMRKVRRTCVSRRV